MKWRIDKEDPRGSNTWIEEEIFDDGCKSFDEDWYPILQARIDELTATTGDSYQASFVSH